MSKVSRSVYQKVVEENKRLLNDIRTIVEGKTADAVLLRIRYSEKFKKEREFNQMMRDYARHYMETNPDDPIVKAVKSFGENTVKTKQC